MLHFQRGAGGKHPEAQSGEHDDLLFADAIAGQLRRYEPGGALVH